jgi:hypothetical protein
MKHQYSVNMNSLEPQLLGCLLLLMNCEVHPKLFFLKIETLKCEHKFAFPKHNDKCVPFWPTYYISYSTLSLKTYKIKCVELLGTSFETHWKLDLNAYDQQLYVHLAKRHLKHQNLKNVQPFFFLKGKRHEFLGCMLH